MEWEHVIAAHEWTLDSMKVINYLIIHWRRMTSRRMTVGKKLLKLSRREVWKMRGVWNVRWRVLDLWFFFYRVVKGVKFLKFIWGICGSNWFRDETCFVGQTDFILNQSSSNFQQIYWINIPGWNSLTLCVYYSFQNWMKKMFRSRQSKNN